MLNRDTIVRWAPLLVLIALILLFALLNPNFLSLRNFARIGIAASPILVIAIGATFILVMGSIDLSMEGAVAVCAVIFAAVMVKLGGTIDSWGWLAVPAALGFGLLFGLVNGITHVKFRIPSFMASLAMGFIGIGISLILSGGDRIRITDELFRSLLTVRVAGFPLMVYLALAILLVGHFIQNHTKLGRNFYAVGGGEELAFASGLNVDRVRIIGFALAGVCAALGAMLFVARIGIGETATGYNLMFTTIASVVVGGTALWGGNGGVWNTLIGVLIVQVIANGMIVIGLPGYIQDGVLGVLVIIAVTLSTDRRLQAFVK